MSKLKCERLESINSTTTMVRIEISSDDIAPKCVNDGKCAVYAFDEETLPFQRDAKNTVVNRELVQCYIDYAEALENGETLEKASDFLPKGAIVVGAEPNKSFNDSKQAALIDGRQRLTAQQRASVILNRKITVYYIAYIVEKVSVSDMAREFVKFNSRNNITQQELVNAAYHYGAFKQLSKKLKIARESGYLYGIEIVPKPRKGKDALGCKQFSLATFLSTLHYAIDGSPSTHKILNRSNDISQLAINNTCLMLSLFEEVIGFKQFRKGSHRNNVFSSATFLAPLARLVLNQNIIEPKGKLDVERFKYFLNFVSNNTEGKSYDFYRFYSNLSAGGAKGMNIVYSSFTSDPYDGNPKSKFGIKILPRNGKGSVVYAYSGMAIENNIEILDKGSDWRNAYELTKA